MRYVLAIDSGGSKCDALLLREDGTAVGWGHCSVAHPESGRGWGGSGRSRETVRLAVMQALDGHSPDELHVSNMGRHGRGELFDRFPLVTPHGVGEAPAAMALAGVSSGVVALAGTGALVSATTRDGRHFHLDGLGPHLGDYGSGYQIGSAALRAAARAEWHPRHQTSLARPVYDACVAQMGQEQFHGLVAYSLSNRDRAEIASLARIVNAEAEGGDRVARQILQDAAAALAGTVRDLVERLDIQGEKYALIGTGGVAARSRLYWEHFCACVNEFAPGLKPFRSPQPAVVGIALAVLAQMEVPVTPGLRRTLYRTTEAVTRGPAPPR